MLVLLSTKADMILEKKCCKKNTVRSLCFGGSKIVFAILAKIVTSYMVITFINVKKAFLEKTFTKAFYNCRSSFYYCSNNILYILICVNSWFGFRTCKSYYWYIEKLQRRSLSTGKFIWVFKEKWWQLKRDRAGGFKNMTLDLM